MCPSIDNKFAFEGKVIEIINSEEGRKVRVLCNPQSLIIEAYDEDTINLGDKVSIEGILDVTEVFIRYNSQTN